jgi:hypothetical protein
MRKRTLQLVTLLALTAATAFGSGTGGFGLTVLVGDNPREQYSHDGTLYVEAIRGASYSLRLTNPTPYRVAVALSVDGLNTIDARHTDPRSATKWVLDPYETAVISGWQVNDRTARSFYFTGERHSYGAALGQTDNLGVIEAVYFRERRPRMGRYAPRSDAEGGVGGALGESAAPSAKAQKNDGLSDEYAGTGMGDRKRHEVESVEIDLEPEPAASVRIRYEFRPQLVKLGVLPSLTSPLDRRERARGFSEYCPEPR